MARIWDALYISLTWYYRESAPHLHRKMFLLAVTLNVVDIFQLLNLIVRDEGG